MGIQGEFKEYVNTGSAAVSESQARYPYVYSYAPVGLNNPPPASAVFWNSTTTDLVPPGSASFQTIYVAAAATFTVLSGSIQPPPTGVSLAAGTNLVGQFTKIRLSGGSIVAYNGVAQ